MKNLSLPIGKGSGSARPSPNAKEINEAPIYNIIYFGMEKHEIRICLGSSCFSRGNEECLEIVKNYLQEQGLLDQIDFRGNLCQDECKAGPNIKIDGILYHEVSTENIIDILDQHFKR